MEMGSSWITCNPLSMASPQRERRQTEAATRRILWDAIAWLPFYHKCYGRYGMFYMMLDARI